MLETPYYIFDEAALTARANTLRSLLPAGAGLVYAVKANPFLAGWAAKTADRLELFQSLLRPFSILEVARTGLIALQKGSGKM